MSEESVAPAAPSPVEAAAERVRSSAVMIQSHPALANNGAGETLAQAFHDVLDLIQHVLDSRTSAEKPAPPPRPMPAADLDT
jgi:hypothetical protein